MWKVWTSAQKVRITRPISQPVLTNPPSERAPLQTPLPFPLEWEVSRYPLLRGCPCPVHSVFWSGPAPTCLSPLAAQLDLTLFSAYPFHTEIIERVTRGEQPPFRPSMGLQSHLEELGRLMQRCWAEDPQERPPFQQIRLALRKFNKSVVSPRQPPQTPHLTLLLQWQPTAAHHSLIGICVAA